MTSLHDSQVGCAQWLAPMLMAMLLAACGSGSPDDDPNVKPNDQDRANDRSVLSPPILRHPIYECASAVVVQGFVPGATIDILVAGTASPVASIVSSSPSGQQITVSMPFVAGQVVTAVQSIDSHTSDPSNAVTVTSHLEDYPSGLPRPRIDPTPIHECGRAVGYRDVVPGGWVRLYTEEPTGGGTFATPVLVKEHASSATGNSYFTFATGLTRGGRVHVESGLCDDVSPDSGAVITENDPTPLDAPSIDTPIYEGEERVILRDFENSAVLTVFDGSSNTVGGQPSPGGSGQVVGINPPAPNGGSYTATQALCTDSPPSVPVPVSPCSELPPAKIEHPLPGDTQVEVTEFVDGSRITIYGGSEEIGDGGGPLINLTRPVQDGETIIVIQTLGDCTSVWIYVVDVDCEEVSGGDPLACSSDWPAFQHSVLRDARQNHPGPLADPYRVRSLPGDYASVSAGNKWEFIPPGATGFRAGPMVFDGRVYIGGGEGFLYALDAATGIQDWQFPKEGQDALVSQFTCNSSSRGIASSATYARIRDEVDAVIFGAPDQSIGAGLGSGRLFAVNAQTGDLIWASAEIAVVNGTTSGSLTERHEQIGYSSPLVYRGRVYIGVADHCDNPIQNGRVVAVDLTNGNIIGSFSFTATGLRGGGVWSSVGAGFDAVYATTGNSAGSGNAVEPSPNHGLSFLRLDRSSGAIDWKLQPVPFKEDGDPDWASGTTTVNASCGDLVLSTMKDGWTYAVQSAPPLSVFWQFPDTGWPFPVSNTTTVHGDTRYHRAGAAWNDVFFTVAGGKDVIGKANRDEVIGGYSRLHAMNICHGPRVRWLLDVPGADPATNNRQTRLSPPSVAGGIVYIGTHLNHLVAIADTSVWPITRFACEHSGFEDDEDACLANGHSLVPEPKILADIVMPGSGGILNEPALAGGRIFVATTGGRVLMVQP